jgi:hypothetical protein
MQENESEMKLQRFQELAKAELSGAIASEKAAHIEKIAEANLNVRYFLEMDVLPLFMLIRGLKFFFNGIFSCSEQKYLVCISVFFFFLILGDI